MKKILLIVSLIYCQLTVGQNKRLFDITRYQHDSCSKKIKALIERTTNLKFDKHPLQWADSQIRTNLLRTDTFYYNEDSNCTIYYFNKSNTLFLIIKHSTKQKNWTKKVTVYDEGGNVILKESYSDSGSLVFRKRRGYSESNIQFECEYYDTPLYRFRIFSKKDIILKPKMNVCECNF